MFGTSIIRHRPGPLWRGPTRVALDWSFALVAAIPMVACELVVGDAPSNKSTADGGESEASSHARGVIGAGGVTSARGGVVSSGGGVPAGGRAAVTGGRDQGGSAQGGRSHGGAGGIFDAGAKGDGGRGGSAVEDASPHGAAGYDAGPPCNANVPWYTDADGDGYGTGAPKSACPAPPGKWARVDGDCNDANAEVHPGQRRYFGMPYQRADNTDSFDYDCSGVEDPNPQLQLAPDSCGLLELALCGSGGGYETNNRQGPGINQWCGSTNVRVCVPQLLVCQTTERTNQSPFSCR